MPGRHPTVPHLTRRAEFLRVAARGRKGVRPGVLLQALPGTQGPLRLGFTATKKIGGAVVRNRAKRRLREAARRLLDAERPEGWDLVLVARDATVTRPFATLLGDLRGALRQVGVPPFAPAAPAPADTPATAP